LPLQAAPESGLVLHEDLLTVRELSGNRKGKTAKRLEKAKGYENNEQFYSLMSKTIQNRATLFREQRMQNSAAFHHFVKQHEIANPKGRLQDHWAMGDHANQKSFSIITPISEHDLPCDEGRLLTGEQKRRYYLRKLKTKSKPYIVREGYDHERSCGASGR